MSDWRQSILSGVDELQVDGNPGTMIVYGTRCKPIITNNQSDILLAAGEVNKGRIVIFTHDSNTHLFLKEPTSNHQLVKNIKSWVSKDAYKRDSEIEDMDKYSNFKDIPKTCKILVWVGMEEKTRKFCDDLKKWISNGGGVVCGATPWGYCQLFPESSLEKMPLAQLLDQIGIKYTQNCLENKNIQICENQVQLSTVEDAIEACRKGIDNLVKYGRNIEAAITCLTDQELEKFLPEINDLVRKYSKSEHFIPTINQPVKTDAGRRLASLICRLMVRTGRYLSEKIAPGIKEFPGDFEMPPELTNGLVTASFDGNQDRTYPTGYYLPAGQDLTVSWSAAINPEWSILVGAHSDVLYDVDSEWRRWPQVQIEKKLSSSPLIFSSPFGGSIYLKTPFKGKAEAFSVTLGNVVPTPIFNQSLKEEWSSRRASPGLWADLSGGKMRITVPSSSVRDIDDPGAVMAVWDSVIDAHYDLRGVDPSSGRGQWAVCDEQPSCGYMHSGYPIITMMDVADPNKMGDDGFLLNASLLRSTGMWGMFHELGHNMQDPMWTWSGTTEVTCNIFTLHAMSVISGKESWSHPWLKRQYPEMTSYLEAGADFNEWLSKPGVALAVYAQLARDFGWDLYKGIFRQYDRLPPGEKPKSDKERVDQWIARCSTFTSRNLCPAFDFWGFPISGRVLDEIKHLPPYMPKDESTEEMAPKRAAYICKQYGIGQ